MLTFVIPVLDEERKLIQIFIFTLSFEAQQRSVKIKINKVKFYFNTTSRILALLSSSAGMIMMINILLSVIVIKKLIMMILLITYFQFL